MSRIWVRILFPENALPDVPKIKISFFTPDFVSGNRAPRDSRSLDFVSGIRGKGLTPMGQSKKCNLFVPKCPRKGHFWKYDFSDSVDWIRIVWCSGSVSVPYWLLALGDNPLFGSIRPILASDWLRVKYSILHTNKPY